MEKQDIPRYISSSIVLSWAKYQNCKDENFNRNADK